MPCLPAPVCQSRLCANRSISTEHLNEQVQATTVVQSFLSTFISHTVTFTKIYQGMAKRREQKKLLVNQIGNTNQIGSTAALCLRCPDFESASECAAASSETVEGCNSICDSDDLWPGFQTDPQSVDSCLLSLSRRDHCLQILKQATLNNAGKWTEAKKTYKKAPEDVFLKLVSLRETITHSVANVDMIVTKDILNAAYDTVHLAPARVAQEKVAALKLGKAAKRKDQTATGVNQGSLKFVKRPQPTATSEQRDSLITNHFTVTLDSQKTLYQYQIEGLVSRNPANPLSSLKKNTIINRMVALTPQLADKVGAFSFNNEGKMIAWSLLHPEVPGDTIVYNNITVPDYDRSSNGVPSGSFSLRVVFKRTLNFHGLDNFVKRLDSG